MNIAVGMSGGVDSSVAAALLVEEGHEVTGFTARMWEGDSGEAIRRAQKVAAQLGIRHHVLDATEHFQRMVLDPFLSEYFSGRTPSPCILCNQHVKFGHLFLQARKLGCTHVATGHYGRISQRDGFWRLHRAADPKKDQSYFLHRLSQEQLEHAVFPLSAWIKERVREFAAQKALPILARGESQDLCFLPDGDYPGFVERHFPELKRAGNIVDEQGRVLGRHEGYHRFTIGQREGLGVAAATRLYVKEVRPERNEVVLGPRENVMSAGCLLEDVHWIAEAPDRLACRVQLRYRHAGVDSVVEKLENGGARVIFGEEQFAVTPGQSAVFYDGDEVLGGGVMAKGLTRPS